jgi:large subunit ribosomal protein L5
MTKAAEKEVKPMKALFLEDVAPRLKEDLGIKNVNAVPQIKYVKVNVGVGTYVTTGKDPQDVVENVTRITGQRPILIKAKKAVSNFKLREGMPNGVCVTLRGKQMYDFLTKLVHIVLPRVRDFQGISPRSFDGRGNYSLGIREHTVFPEISSEDISKLHGVQITIVTSAGDDEKGLALLKGLGFPFKK